ncbi:STAS domain-containing protein [Deltaproteobacteria bacterium TL4]
MIKISHEILKAYCVIKVEGKVVLDEAIELKKFLLPFLEDERVRGVILNLSEAKVFDSAGLGVLGWFHKRYSRQNKPVALCHVNQTCLDLFTLSGMDKTFKIFESVDGVLTAWE